METTKISVSEQKVTFKSEGEKIAGKLLLPAEYDKGDLLPAYIVLGPWTQVKEQVQYAYGKELAAMGLVVLNFDFRYWGESGGKPRFFESTGEKVKDALAAVNYLKTLPYVDSTDINLLGVCAGAGIAARVALKSEDIASVATVAAWLQHPTSTPQFYGGEEGVQLRIDLAEKARKKFDEQGTVEYVDAYNPDDDRAAMFFPLDYYGNPARGAVKEWDNKFAVMGWKEWMELNSIDGLANKLEVPIVMVHSDASALPDNVKKFFSLVPVKKKELVWLAGEHTQFYDNTEHISQALKSILEFKTVRN